MEPIELSENERTALLLVHRKKGVLLTNIPERNEKGIFGDTTPGRGVFAKLEKRGLCFETEEDPAPDGFQFTPTMELTALGEQVVARMLAPAPPQRRPR